MSHDDGRAGAAPCPGALIESAGPWPFTTHARYRLPDRSISVWQSRRHRKGLRDPDLARAETVLSLVLRSCFMPGRLNWWIGTVFALGSALFILGSVTSLAPALASRWGLDGTGINVIFFAGSIPFTTAAYLQLYQAANAGAAPDSRAVLFGWRPQDIGWLAAALQLPGTVLFNVNTFDALLPGLDWLQQDLAIWAPDVAGSVLFLASGYLAFAEAGHAHLSWRPASLSWWVTAVNLLGCVAFMVSAVFAVVLPHPPGFDAGEISVVFTLIGAAGFLVGSLLMLPEGAGELEQLG